MIAIIKGIKARPSIIPNKTDILSLTDATELLVQSINKYKIVKTDSNESNILSTVFIILKN